MIKAVGIGGYILVSSFYMSHLTKAYVDKDHDFAIAPCITYHSLLIGNIFTSLCQRTRLKQLLNGHSYAGASG